MKIDKEFVLSDSSLNCYSYRLLTSGYQISLFEKNPIGYYMHERDLGVLLRWEDLEIQGDKVVGKPVINMAHPRGQQTVDEINSGFLNAASVGFIVALEQSEDSKLKLPGQTGPTVTKWYNRECSIVDIPGNFNAYCLYDKEGSIITDLKHLSAKIEGNPTNEDLLSMSWSQLDKAGLLEALKEKNYSLFALKYKTQFGKDWQGTKPTSKLFSLSKKTKADLDTIDIGFLLSDALVYNDITEEIAQELKRQQEEKPDIPQLLSVLDSFATLRLNYLMGLEWNELDRSNKLTEELQEKSMTEYKLKRYSVYGKKVSGIIDNEAFLQFGIDNDYISEDYPTWNLEENSTNTKDVIFSRIWNLIVGSTEKLKNAHLDNLSPDQINRLKQEAFRTYKKNYFATFGVPCKERFEVKNLNKNKN